MNTLNNSAKCPISNSLLLSIATVPLIVSLNILDSLNQNLIELGQASEEVFRGSRLPMLNFSDAQGSNPD